MQTSGPFSRRRFVGAAGAAVAAIAAPIAAPGLIRIAAAQSWRAGNPFSLGVASGAPRPDGFVLWTRLAPEPLSTNPETPGGMTGADVTLRYEIATDPGMTKIVRRGAATAEQAFAYSVHLDVAGLESGRSYWYRFLSGDAVSPTGRAVTFPAPGSARAKLRFGFVSCSNYEHGYFSAYRHLTGEIRPVPRRLHLRDHRAIPADRSPPQRWYRSSDPADLSQSLCPIPARCRPARAARASAGHRHLGRSRSAERLCR